MIRFLNIMLFIIFTIIVIIFAAQNPEMVSVRFLEFASIKLPITVIVISSALIGIIITLIYHFYVILKLKRNFKNVKTSEPPAGDEK